MPEFPTDRASAAASEAKPLAVEYLQINMLFHIGEGSFGP
jgi:hypothetical protein